MWKLCIVLCLCVLVNAETRDEYKKTLKQRINLSQILRNPRLAPKYSIHLRNSFVDSSLGVHSRYESHLLPEEYFYEKLVSSAPPPPPEERLH